MTKLFKGWQDLGYRSAPELPLNNPDMSNEQVATFFEGYAGYSRQNKRWVRLRGRGKGEAPPSRVSVASVCTPANRTDAATFSWVGPFLASKYGQAANRHGVTANTTTCANLVQTLLDPQVPRYQSMVNIGKAIGFLNPSEVPDFLRDVVLPTFFSKYPDGRVVVVATDEVAETQAGLLRGLYSFAYTSRRDIAKVNSFPVLREWQETAGHSMVPLLLDCFGYLFYPNVTTYRCGTIGLDFVFIFDTPESHQPPVFPGDWLALPRARSTFGEESVDGRQAVVDPKSSQAQAVTHRRYMHSVQATSDQTVDFLSWWIHRINHLLTELADPANYTLDRDPSRDIDVVYAFENHITVSRMLKRIAASLGASEGSYTKGMMFEVADLLGGLQKRNAGSDDVAHFQLLFHPVDGPTHIKPHLNSLPAPFDAYLSHLVDDVYNDLKATLLDSIWVPNKRVNGNVLVLDKHLKVEAPMDENEFVARAIRAYRNGHHGYFTQTDNSKRPSRFLYMLSGNTPDSMSALATLWLVAFMASPESIAGLPSLGVQMYEG